MLSVLSKYVLFLGLGQLVLSVPCSEDCVVGAGGKQANLEMRKGHRKPEAICSFHLHMCTCKGPHRAPPEVLLLMGLRGPYKHSSSYENKLEAIRLLHSFAIKVLVLSPL